MATAFHNGGGRNDRQAGFLLQFRDGQRTTVAHGGTHLVQRGLHAIGQRAGIRNVRINALLKAQLLGTAKVIALPVAGTVGTFAPVFLHIVAANAQLVRGGFIKAGKVTAQHNKVSAHCQCQGDVVVMHNAAIGADGDIDAGLLIVFIAGFGNLDNGSCLAAANALGLAGDADGAAANADLDKVCTCLLYTSDAADE